MVSHMFARTVDRFPGTTAMEPVRKHQWFATWREETVAAVNTSGYGIIDALLLDAVVFSIDDA